MQSTYKFLAMSQITTKRQNLNARYLPGTPGGPWRPGGPRGPCGPLNASPEPSRSPIPRPGGPWGPTGPGGPIPTSPCKNFRYNGRLILLALSVFRYYGNISSANSGIPCNNFAAGNHSVWKQWRPKHMTSCIDLINLYWKTSFLFLQLI